MSLNKYIRSKTIRDYYESIDYEISPLVAFWVILNNDYRYANDMHSELRDLIDNTDDICIDDLCLNIDVVPTLHSLINHYIDLFDYSFQRFKSDEEGAIFSIYDREKDDDHEGGFLGSYSSYDECMNEIRIRTGNYKNVSYRSISKWSAKEFLIRKSLGDEYDYMHLHISKDKKIINLYDYTDPKMQDFIHCIEDIEYSIPLPFEYGDIVREARPNGWLSNLIYDGRLSGDDGYMDPFVACNLVTEESDIFAYVRANPFKLEQCNPNEKNIFPLTRSISLFEKRKKRIGEFLKEYEAYKIGKIAIAGN